MRPDHRPRAAARLLALSLALGLTSAAAAQGPSPDPRVGLRAGKHDAAEAAWNLRRIATAQPGPQFAESSEKSVATTIRLMDVGFIRKT